MENLTIIGTNFVLLGIVEMEKCKYLVIVMAIVLYVFIMFACSTMVYTIWAEQTLHEPMYIFICNLVIDVMYGSSAFFPKVIIDLLTGGSTITLYGCLGQAFCIQCFSAIETTTFSAMAYDRYLAVAKPLRYHQLMSNGKAVKILAGIWVYYPANLVAIVILTGRLTYCGGHINNAFCETMSLLFLARSNTTIVNLYSTAWTLSLVIFCVGTNVFCYVGTFVVCLKMSMEASRKSIHTLITHMMTFSTCMASGLFVIFRYRLNGGYISLQTHVVIAVCGLTLSLTLNPLVYGIRMEALRGKIILSLQKLIRSLRNKPTSSDVR